MQSVSESNLPPGGRITLLACVGLTVAVLWVRSSSEDNGDFSLGVNMVSDSIPPKLFQMRV